MPEQQESTLKEQKEGLKKGVTGLITSVKDGLKDIVNLEINTIVVNNISATHRASDEEYLKDIKDDLTNWFERNQVDSSTQEPFEDVAARMKEKNDKAREPLADAKELNQNSVGYMLNEIWIGEKETESKTTTIPAKAILKDVQIKIEDSLSIIKKTLAGSTKPDYVKMTSEQQYKRADYRRHLYYSEQYLQLYEHFVVSREGKSPAPLNNAVRSQIRKLWEIVNTDFIYAQTVIGFDGDVVSRINQQLIDNSRPVYKESVDRLLNYHLRNVEAGSIYRSKMIEMLVQVAKALIGRIG